MLGIYLTALVASLGVFAVQLLGGHHDLGGGHDVSHGASASSGEETQDGEYAASAWSLMASTRFWSFALLAFGLVGTALTLFGLAGSWTAILLSSGSGAASGFFAASVIRSLAARPATSHVTTRDVVGQVGRVLVPLVPGGAGKVRVEIKGGVVDYVARAKESVGAGESVVVLEEEDGELLVSRAPKELDP